MNWFKNLKIKTKLLISFLIVAFITGVVGFVGMIKLQQTDESDTFLYEKHALSLAIIGDLRSDFLRQRMNVLEAIIFAKDINKRQDAIKKMKERDASINKNIPEYEKTYSDENDIKLFEEFKNAWNDYLPDRDKILTMSETSIDEALLYFRGDYDVKVTKTRDLLEKISTGNEKSAKERSDLNSEQARMAQNTIIITVLLGVIIAIVLGMWLANYISKSINKVVEGMKNLSDVDLPNLGYGCQQLANGDLNIKYAITTKSLEVSSEDEIGQLTKSMNEIITNTKETTASVEKAVTAIKDTIN